MPPCQCQIAAFLCRGEASGATSTLECPPVCPGQLSRSVFYAGYSTTQVKLKSWI